MVTFRAFRSEDRIWVLDANVTFYQTEHGFDASFRDAVEAALDLLERQRSDAASHYVIVEADGTRVGCIFLSAEGPEAGRVRLFYLHEAFRRRGIGLKLLRSVIDAAEEAELDEVRISTFDQHAEACRLYEANGFEIVGTAETRAFGRAMIQVDYALQLDRT